ncbi:phosphatase [Streptomyces spiroverticillatus]|uniref:Phosphatase n=1 Tax=Streptomyces finlayi TaxID=67296 RepID=A0A919CEB2_9ACTN|nr:PP2C family protein-serine/threonine phosphatase [Streptomyces finlayi]GHA30189.1 phosphatase [Streptomyces spiroverticillatus]GHD15030.1 phosphatase [Streptomyces finlayi]
MDRFATAARALHTAAPHALVDTVRAVCADQYGATEVDLWMADYAMTMLQPVTVPPYTAQPVPIRNSDPGRALGSQQPFVCKARYPNPPRAHLSRPAKPLAKTPEAGPAVTAHLPVSVRGDRLGVLSVTLPEGDDSPQALAELAQLADVLAHELVVADRDTDLYLQARRATRLTLAAEMQWQLLPGRSCTRPEYTLGAQLEPAYAIYGDNFDWATTADTLTLTVTNGMGDGIKAALLTNLAVNALRNARRAGLTLADQAALADQALYAEHQGAQHVAALLFEFDLATGAFEVIDAGSPKIWRLRKGVVEPIELEPQLPLGMFEDTPYIPQHHRVEPGDRLLIVSDGVYASTSEDGELFSARPLTRVLSETRLLPATQVPHAVLDALAAHRVPGADSDDAMILCLDWHGRSADGENTHTT